MEQREIKFEVWDVENKLIRKVDGIFFPLGSKNGKDITCESLNDSRVDEWIYGDYILRQFIGLHDKNEKEVYHKDIVEKNVVGFGKCRAVIEMEDWVQFFLKPIDEDKWIEDWEIDDVDNFEIIGNAFDNPELLTDSQPPVHLTGKSSNKENNNDSNAQK